jgi:hypothetical protein
VATDIPEFIDPCEEMESTPGAPFSEDLTESALEAQLRACELENWTPPAQKLAEENVPLLPPAEITDETLTPILWELLHNLALRGFYVSHMDHLSDRELYLALWKYGLREPAHLPGRNPRGEGSTIFGAVGATKKCNSGCGISPRTRSAPGTPQNGRKLPSRRKKNSPSIATGVCRKGRSEEGNSQL